MNISGFMFLLAIMYFKPQPNESRSISVIMNGSLSNSWHFNFTILASKFLGVVIYTIDSRQNQLLVKVTKEINSHRSVHLMYNKVYKDITLKLLCGCDSCDESLVHFIMKLNDFLITVTCNNYNSETLAINGHKDHRSPEKDNIIYPIPMNISKETGLFSIRMGNIGPYIGENNREVYPIRDQMTGCLVEFKYNGKTVMFTEKSDMIKSECSTTCSSSICNHGICENNKNQGNISMCNCSLTALNGQFCNNSMVMYKQGENNSYIARVENNISFKFTWKQTSKEMYCLLNIGGRQKNTSIWFDGSSVLMDDIVISRNNMNGNHFLTLRITKTTLLIQKNNNVLNMTFSEKGNIQVDVGFSTKNNICKSYEGEYDIYYDSSKWRRKEHQIQNDSSTNANKTHLRSVSLVSDIVTSVRNDYTIKAYVVDIRIIIIFVVVTFIALLILLGGTNLLLFRKIRKSDLSCNTYEIQHIESPVPSIGVALNTEYDMYSALEYGALNEFEDEDGYILPKSPRPTVDRPVPPPRIIK